MSYQPRPFASGDTLNASRDPIRTNFQVIRDDFAINHVAFDEAGQGKHKFVEMPNQGTIPAGLVASEGTVYVKVANGRSQLFYTNEDSGNEYQLTRTNNGDFATFSTNAAYGTPPAGFTQIGGWTFLPGGMLFQYGFFGKASDLGVDRTIEFPKSFTNAASVFSISATLFRTSGRPISISSASLPTATSFTVLMDSSGSSGVYWTAIGV